MVYLISQGDGLAGCLEMLHHSRELQSSLKGRVLLQKVELHSDGYEERTPGCLQSRLKVANDMRGVGGRVKRGIVIVIARSANTLHG